jgi:hypothetical protein
LMRKITNFSPQYEQTTLGIFCNKMPIDSIADEAK